MRVGIGTYVRPTRGFPCGRMTILEFAGSRFAVQVPPQVPPDGQLQVSGTFQGARRLLQHCRLDAAGARRRRDLRLAGNHAVALVCSCAMGSAIGAKVVMIKTRQPRKSSTVPSLRAAKSSGEDGARRFATVHATKRDEGRFFVHPFKKGIARCSGAPPLGANGPSSRAAGLEVVKFLPSRHARGGDSARRSRTALQAAGARSR